MNKLLLLVMAVMLVGCGGDGTDGTMECYFCKEDIKRRALVCKFCREDNSYGIMRAESERESEMSDRDRDIFQMYKDNLEKYKSGEINKSEYEHGKAWWSPGGEGFQTLMDDPDYDSDGNLNEGIKKKMDEPINWTDTICSVLVFGGILAVLYRGFIHLPKGHCSACGKEVDSRNDLIKHLKECRAVDSSTRRGAKSAYQKLLDSAGSQSYLPKSTKCNACGKEFDSRDDLIEHLKECPFGRNPVSGGGKQSD